MRLEFPEKKHEKDYLQIIQEFLENQEEIVPGQMKPKEWEDFDKFIVRCEDYREWKNMKPGRVKQTLYFLIDDNGKVVWAEAIRYELNEKLKFDGGNIAYGIRPSERKKWYATIWLKLALEKCKEAWLEKVLLTCNKKNIWSSKVMIKNWWIFDSEYEDEWIPNQRYRIPVI